MFFCAPREPQSLPLLVYFEIVIVHSDTRRKRKTRTTRQWRLSLATRVLVHWLLASQWTTVRDNVSRTITYRVLSGFSCFRTDVNLTIQTLAPIKFEIVPGTFFYLLCLSAWLISLDNNSVRSSLFLWAGRVVSNVSDSILPHEVFIHRCKPCERHKLYQFLQPRFANYYNTRAIVPSLQSPRQN